MKVLLLPIPCLALLLPVSAATDWPQYLGPNGGAVSPEKINGDWMSTPPRTLWTAKVGKGCGSWAVKDGKALVMGNDGSKDTVWCFDAGSGKVIWRHVYPESISANLYEGGP
ncbi:MAG: alcohol dehydrogenase, partial [Akkermansiaceae bacterium]|nr:alcohol dehydrogenase [Akkermansiaceae bacterium]